MNDVGSKKARHTKPSKMFAVALALRSAVLEVDEESVAVEKLVEEEFASEDDENEACILIEAMFAYSNEANKARKIN